MAAAVVLAVRFAQGNFVLSRTAQGVLPIALQELAAGDGMSHSKILLS